MTGKQFIKFTNAHGWTVEHTAELFGVSLRTAKYWRVADEVPGPVALAVRAMALLSAHKLKSLYND